MSRPPATVALDLRLAGRVAAVAVNRRGGITAWKIVSGDVFGGGDPVALARRALRELAVRPKEVRVLLGSEQAQVAVLDHHARAPEEAAITAALFAEGYERLREPAVAALSVSPQTWLVAACGDAAIEPLAAGLLEEGGTEPLFTVDQLLLAQGLEAGSALVELGETGLLIAAHPSGSTFFVRSLPAVVDVEEAAREGRESLETAGFDGTIQVCGPHRDSLARLLTEGGAAAVVEPLPASGGEPLPAACELARRLALRSPRTNKTVPRLASPRGERRRTSLAWARRAIRIAVAVAALGALLMMAGLRIAWTSRTRNLALVSQASGEARLVKEMREVEVLVGEVERLRAELAGQTAPWPRLAETAAALARQLPPEVGWESFTVKEGALELTAAARGTAPAARLELLRHALQSSPGIVNLSWEAPAADPQGTRLRQVFRGVLRGMPGAAPQGKP
jgi:hypothetical protein